jgi:hypothetical protein
MFVPTPMNNQDSIYPIYHSHIRYDNDSTYQGLSHALYASTQRNIKTIPEKTMVNRCEANNKEKIKIANWMITKTICAKKKLFIQNPFKLYTQ